MSKNSINNLYNESSALLEGIKVLDLSRILAGPWASQALADFGATVWKIEKPGVGDDTRHWGPPYLNRDSKKASLSAYFMAANRGKYSICIDLTKKQGQLLIIELARKADILIENFKVGSLKKYGLDYPSLCQVNPSLIYCSITGFGQTGPRASEAGYDAMIQALGGLMSITGASDKEGEKECGKAQKVGVAVTDLMTGMYATTGILAALNYRNATGIGQHIDLSLLDTQIAMLANQGMNYLVSGNIPLRYGNGHPNIVPYQTFSCNDGEILLAVGNDEQFKKTCQLLGLAELSEDDRFKSNKQRVINRNSLIPQLAKVFLTESYDHWLRLLNEVGVPCGPVNNIQQALDDPQVKHRNLLFDLMDKHDKKVPQIANPLKFSKLDLSYHLAPPILGDSTNDVLCKELNLSEAEISELKSKGVIK
jgi:crotonobetainyl-CoA:carnitine CoA-transferase CaiB-like acyl-CoA transferase